jgi:hypothetical protein
LVNLLSGYRKVLKKRHAAPPDLAKASVHSTGSPPPLPAYQQHQVKQLLAKPYFQQLQGTPPHLASLDFTVAPWSESVVSALPGLHNNKSSFSQCTIPLGGDIKYKSFLWDKSIIIRNYIILGICDFPPALPFFAFLWI